MQFSPYPFERLNNLIKDIKPTKEIIKLTIGEPQFNTPQDILDSLCQNAYLLNKYPPSKGESYLFDAQIKFIKDRFKIDINPSQIIPTFGTREVLFNFPSFFLHNKKRKNIAFPNPFYKVYEGAAIASNAQINYIELDSSFNPKIDKYLAKEADLIIINSPNNPTGAALSLDSLCQIVELGREYNCVILSDECYSEIYEDSPPHSILEACIATNNKNFKNILALNSISKRASAPGLRSGFIAGDENILKDYARFRTYVGLAIPLPLQKAAVIAWNDRKNCQYFRKIYANNLKLGREILGVKNTGFTFYIWLKVADDIAFTKNLYENEGILVLPGRFLGANGAGAGFVRIALVYEENLIKNALVRLKKWVN